MRFALAIALPCLLLPVAVEAKPDLTGEFSGERWRLAQAGTTGADVTRTMRCPPPHCVRKATKTKWKKRYRPPGYPEVKARPVPIPTARPAGAPEPDEEAAAFNAAWDRIAESLRAKEPPKVLPLARLNLFEGFAREIVSAFHPRGRSLAGIVKPLADKITQVASVCPGLRVISTIRPGAVVRGSGRPSLHRYGKAVDISGDYRCLYAALKTFAGGVSIDAHRVRHIHVSWDPKGREWGARFAHYRGGMKRTRHARHHRRQYASAR